MSQCTHSPKFDSRPASRRVGAFSLIAAAGMIVGLGSAPAAAQSAKASAQGANINNSGNHAQSDSVTQGKPMHAKLGEGDQEYIIADPSAKKSLATRFVNPAAPNETIVKTVFSQVVVGVENEQVLARVLQTAAKQIGRDAPGAYPYRKYLDLDNVFVVEAISVEDALMLSARLDRIDGVNWTEVNYQDPVANRSMGAPTIPSDPSSPFQWHIFNDPTIFPPPFDGNHMIDLVYGMGITGAGVRVGVLEAFENSFYRVDNDGVLQIHPDLVGQTNFDLSIDTAPFDVSYSHGVSVAGLIGSQANNGLAGAGVAYGAELVSLRNGSNIEAGQSLGHALQDIAIVNNSWGPVLEASFPGTNTGRVLITPPADYEITIPRVLHTNLSPITTLGLDQGIRLGRHRDGRIFVFAAGNSSHFQGFDRFAVGNAISLPGIGMDPMVDEYGYLDIQALDPTDADFDGLPDTFLTDGTLSMNWRWSGHFGGRTEYDPYTSLSRTLAIASVGQSNAVSGYSTTGTSVFIGAYSQDSLLAQEFSPNPPGWPAAVSGLGVLTLEQADGVDDDSLNCNATIPGLSFVDDDLETCMFNGTSAAAPIASGIIALMLEANPSLTLRDIQAILQQTAMVPETTGADPANSDFYDPTKSYWPSVFANLGRPDSDDNPNSPTPTLWTTNAAGIRHSDEYGFGIIDANAAVQAAQTWPGVGQLIILNTGLQESGQDGGNPNFTEGAIEDATFVQSNVVSENLEINRLVPGTRFTLPITCVRDNLEIEGVEIDLTIEGDGAGDLLIALESPYGTMSPLAIPRGDEGQYLDHTFTTYKNWGELSGGTWVLHIQDFRPDESSPEGDPPDDMPDPMDPASFGVEQVTALGVFGLPGNPNNEEKTLVSYNLRIFGHEINAPVFEGCPPLLTGCPGDLDGNGVVDVLDLQIFVAWYTAFDPRADMDGDGDIDYTDLLAYRAIWVPGFCGMTNPFVGGRPRPGTTDLGDNDAVIRPI